MKPQLCISNVLVHLLLGLGPTFLIAARCESTAVENTNQSAAGVLSEDARPELTRRTRETERYGEERSTITQISSELASVRLLTHIPSLPSCGANEKFAQAAIPFKREE